MRQLLVTDGTAPAFVNNVLAPGQLAIVGRTADGFTELSALAPGTIAATDAIRFVQAGENGETNILSPWIYGKDIVGWSGRSFTGQTAQVTTIDFVTSGANLVADAEITIKLTSTNGGHQQYKRKSFTVSLVAGSTPTQQATAIATAMSLNIPDFVATVADNLAGVLTLTGTLFSLSAGTELGSWATGSEGLDGTNGAAIIITATASPSLGYGDAEVLKQYEESLQGDKSYYNRIVQPNTPETYIDLSADYDVYTIRVKNPVPGSIYGVDNTREISIAYVDGGADQANFETDINTYLASCPGGFAAVNL